MKRALAITLLSAGALVLVDGSVLADADAGPKLPVITDAPGRVLVRHIDDQAKLTRWSTKVRVSRGLGITFACVGGPAITVTSSRGPRIREKCDGTVVYYEAPNLSKRKQTYTVRVRVQPGTRWEVFVSELKDASLVAQKVEQVQAGGLGELVE